MEEINKIYNENKLLVRAMDWPRLQRNGDSLEYDCTTWANEFSLLKNQQLSSASTTLIVPNVGVSTYKNIGFLINSDLANCFHISVSDSGSNGDIKNGDFSANKPDFTKLADLAKFIIDNNSTHMNEVNIVTNIDSVVGLFINKCSNQKYLLEAIFIIQRCLIKMLNIEYPLYLYDSQKGIIERIILTPEMEEEITANLPTKNIFYWPDDFDEPVIESLNHINQKAL